MDSATISGKDEKDLSSIRSRIENVDQKLALSKQALREWVQKQNQEMDLMEEELENKAEAIDVVESVDLTPIIGDCIQDSQVKSLIEQADALISESVVGTRSDLRNGR